jgi:hypothetical protein
VLELFYKVTRWNMGLLKFMFWRKRRRRRNSVSTKILTVKLVHES